MITPLFVSIIIPTFNRARLLPQTLDSFLAQTYPMDRLEIIVVNNNSADDTQTVIAHYCSHYPIVKTITEKRQGVHYARNSAAMIARGDILYFTDDDMIADRVLIEEIVKLFELDPLIGSATGKVIGRFETPPPRWVQRYLINRYLSLTESDKAEELVLSRNDIVYSCHEAVKRDVFFHCGGFNPENTAGVWIGDGETGLGIRMKQAGFKFAYTSKSVIYHLIPASRTTLRYLVKRFGNQGYCDSYTEYRTHRSRSRILKNLVVRNTEGLMSALAKSTAKIIIGRESWHFIPAWLFYFHYRNLYDFKLIRNSDFRKIVEIDDWLKDDIPMIV